MSNHTYTKKIGGDSIYFVVIQVERETVMTIPVKEFCQKKMVERSDKRVVGSSFSRFGSGSRNMESPVDEPRMCALRMWMNRDLGLWGVVSYAPLLVCRQYASEQFILATHGLNKLEFTYGDPGYAA